LSLQAHSEDGGPIGVFGGTFDPIHYGHLRTALELQEAAELAEVRFVPCGEPPHRGDPPRIGDMRLEMVRAAVADQRGFVVDDREFLRPGPSYTVDTLASLKSDFPTQGLCLLLGMDAFLGLHTWHRWQEIIDLAHLIVAHRPGWTAPGDGIIGDLLRERRTSRVEPLHETPSGLIFVQAVTQLEISASDLRRALAAGTDPRYLLPESVREMILRSNCYR
jgi:nicotinate-nucleotide adenylyltransferase